MIILLQAMHLEKYSKVSNKPNRVHYGLHVRHFDIINSKYIVFSNKCYPTSHYRQ